MAVSADPPGLERVRTTPHDPTCTTRPTQKPNPPTPLASSVLDLPGDCGTPCARRSPQTIPSFLLLRATTKNKRFITIYIMAIL